MNDALVDVALPDGGQTSAERIDALRAAYDAVPVDGRLLVTAHVVTATGGATNPSISELVEDLDTATGLGTTVLDLRSFRLPGETIARGVELDLRRIF